MDRRVAIPLPRSARLPPSHNHCAGPLHSHTGNRRRHPEPPDLSQSTYTWTSQAACLTRQPWWQPHSLRAGPRFEIRHNSLPCFRQRARPVTLANQWPPTYWRSPRWHPFRPAWEGTRGPLARFDTSRVGALTRDSCCGGLVVPPYWCGPSLMAYPGVYSPQEAVLREGAADTPVSCHVFASFFLLSGVLARCRSRVSSHCPAKMGG